jgi:rhamnose utilization protein RhaD (predicted bifunctional aldolase and dehydrogenase)
LELESLNSLSAALGADSSLIQGAGGNLSFKSGDRLIIKASGTSMSQAKEKNIFTEVKISEILGSLEAGNDNLPPDPLTGHKPSIETLLHVVMPHPLVVHLHMLSAIIFAAMANGAEIIGQKLNGLNFAFLDYHRPGLPLALAARDAIKNFKSPPDILILKKHGLVLGANSRDELILLLNDCIRRLDLPPRAMQQPRIDRLLPKNDLDWLIDSDPLPHNVALDKTALNLAKSAPLYPDHLVFLGPVMLILGPSKPLALSVLDHTIRHGHQPKVAIIPEAGVLISPDASFGAVAMLKALALTGLRAPESVPIGGFEGLDANQCRELMNFNAESHRLKMDAY